MSDKIDIKSLANIYPVTTQPSGQRQIESNHIQDRLAILAPLDGFTIEKTSLTTRSFKNKAGDVIFSYNESVTSPLLTTASMRFVLTSGVVFMDTAGDMSGWKIMIDELILGTANFDQGDFSSITLPAVTGEVLKFTGNTGFCLCCCCVCSKPNQYSLTVNGNQCGEIVKQSPDIAIVTFPANIDVKLKALIVVGSMMAYNSSLRF